jgi:hypothetical protein
MRRLVPGLRVKRLSHKRNADSPLGHENRSIGKEEFTGMPIKHSVGLSTLTRSATWVNVELYVLDTLENSSEYSESIPAVIEDRRSMIACDLPSGSYRRT